MFDFAAPKVSPRSPAAGAFIVREARRDDLDAAVALERTCFGEGGFSLTKRQLQYLYRRPTAVFMVAEQSGRVVGDGVALVRKHKSRQNSSSLSGRIYSVAVDPCCRGQGVGEALVQWCLDRAADSGVRSLRLSTLPGMTAAGRLYLRLGFVRTPERDWSPEPGVELITYGREIGAAVTRPGR